MRSSELVAGLVLKACLEIDPDAEILKGVKAKELALLVYDDIGACPACGSEAGVNIDCEICDVIDGLARGTLDCVNTGCELPCSEEKKIQAPCFEPRKSEPCHRCGDAHE